MKKITYTLILSIITTSLFAQSYVERILILNEGYFDYFSGDILTPVSVGAYDPEIGTYVMLDEIENARFASDIVLDETSYYIAADKYLLQYNLLTDELLNAIEIPGIRKIAVDDNYIVVTRGEYLVSFDSYIQVYNKSTLNLEFEILNAELNYTTEGVVIKDGIAYVAVNNGFNFGFEVGMIAEIDLIAHSLNNLVDLGANGINPDNLMLDGDNIYTLNNKDFTGSSVSAYKIISGDITTTDLENISSGCGTSAFVDGSIYYQEMFGTTLSKFDPAVGTIISEEEYGISFYGLAFDNINNLTYTSETDYFSFGKVNIFNASGIMVNTFDVSVSPGNFAFDVRTSTAINNMEEILISLYPNPAADKVTISAEKQIQIVVISDIFGKKLLEFNNVNSTTLSADIKDLVSGNYLISIITATNSQTQIVSKI